MAGNASDDVGTYPAGHEQLRRYADAQDALAKFPVPVLLQQDDPYERLFIASFDGSGLDADNPRDPQSNVGIIDRQVKSLERQARSRIASGYQSGPGSQSNPVSRALDGVLGYSYDERIERMYRQLADRARKWLIDVPNAHISIAAVGFSRGAVEIPGFARLVDRYGILDPVDLHFSRDRSGELRVDSARPPLVAAGQVAQAVALFDPVATGIPMDYDRRLPASVVSGFSLLAADERRRLFPHTALIDREVTADGRFLGVTVPGAHSDVGGSYHRNGLEIRAGNLAIDYLNALAERPFLAKRAVPDDPAMNVVHRSEQGLLGFYEIGSTHVGDPRPVRERLCVVVDPCRDAEPRDDALAARFPTQLPRIGALPVAVVAAQLDDPRHPRHALYAQALSGVARLDAGHGRAPDARSERMAAALAASAHVHGLSRIDAVVLSDDHLRLFAVDTHVVPGSRRIAHVDVAAAIHQSLRDSGARVDRFDALHPSAPPQPPLAVQLAAPDASRSQRAPALAQ